MMLVSVILSAAISLFAGLMAWGAAILVQKQQAKIEAQAIRLATLTQRVEASGRSFDAGVDLMRAIAEQNAKLASAQHQDHVVLHGALQMLGVELQHLPVTKH